MDIQKAGHVTEHKKITKKLIVCLSWEILVFKEIYILIY